MNDNGREHGGHGGSRRARRNRDEVPPWLPWYSVPSVSMNTILASHGDFVDRTGRLRRCQRLGGGGGEARGDGEAVPGVDRRNGQRQVAQLALGEVRAHG